MSEYPKDRFDELPADLDRRGAHRAPRSRGSKIASWLWGLGALCALVLIGIVGMLVVDGIVSYKPAVDAAPTTAPAGEAPADASPTPTPSVDPNLKVTVLNGTGGSGVATAGSKELTAAGWNVVDIGDASTQDHATTTVAYAEEKDAGAALKIVEQLGGGEAKLDPAAAKAGAIVVTIGRDVADD